MSSEQSILAHSQTTRPQRVLACVLCQQRKVKCDRKFPCSNCTKSGAQCVPATKLPRQRRRRFAERELLDQLRRYEDLLRQNKIEFDPLHKDPSGTKDSPNAERGDDQEEETSAVTEGASPSSTVKSERLHEVKSFWEAVRNRFGDDDDSEGSDHEAAYALDEAISTTMNRVFINDGSLILGLSQIPVDLFPLHPEPAQVFRLWQLYLDNVNPLLRVVHIPTVQVYIIEAVSDMKSMKTVIEALMFSIYSAAIFSLNEDDCLTTFGGSKTDLLTKYQFGCQQALAKCGLLRTTDRVCLTAFYFYMISFTHTTHPRSISTISAMIIRIAQRMKIDKEPANAEYDVLEAEMRRRLWWAIALYDLRICQLAGEKTKTLVPTFDCRVPLNLNDTELRAEMKEAPPVHDQPTDTMYAVVRAEIGDYMRHTSFNLAYNAPELAPLARIRNGPVPEGGELVDLERWIEQKYLKFCNPENPLHFVTMWEARTNIAKCRLMEDYSLHMNSETAEVDDRLDISAFHAIRMLECDTKILTSPLTKGFRWMSHFNFPFTGYIHLVTYLKRSPLSEHADKSWQALSDNFDAWDTEVFHMNDLFFHMVCKMLLSAWSHRETALIREGEVIVPVRMIEKIRDYMKLEGSVPRSQGSGFDWIDEAVMEGGGTGLGGLFDMMPMNFGNSDSYGLQPFSDMPVQPPLDANMNSLDWAASTMDWEVGTVANRVNMPGP